MRALRLHGDRDLRIDDIAPPPPPGPGEVQIRPLAVALNHIDVWGWRGMAFAKRNLPLVEFLLSRGVNPLLEDANGVRHASSTTLVELFTNLLSRLMEICRKHGTLARLAPVAVLSASNCTAARRS